MDNAATTKVREEVSDSMISVLKNNYGNPSSSHSYGRSARSIIELSRNEIAKTLNVKNSEIIFTSGGTEGDNLIIRNSIKYLDVKHIITSKIEHHAVTHTVDDLQENKKIKVSYVKLSSDGTIDYDDLENLLSNSNNKTLVSLMHINNEIGNILDISRVADLTKKYSAYFHSDTVQSIGHYEMDLKKYNIDFVVASAHKFHGPKGVGFVYINNKTKLGPFFTGGMQEKGVRAGTECVHNIFGMSEALKHSTNNLKKEKTYITKLKKYFITKLIKLNHNITFNGKSNDFDNSTYTLVNISIPIKKQNAELLMFKLDLKGIACSKGSACQSGSDLGSHVLREIQNNNKNQFISLRFSFSIYNTEKEIDVVVKEIKNLIIKNQNPN